MSLRAAYTAGHRSRSHPWAICSILIVAVSFALPLSAHAYNHPSQPPNAAVTDEHMLSGGSWIGWLRLCGITALGMVFIWSTLSCRVNSAMVIGCWMLTSMAMNLVNKEVAVSFKATNLIIILQMLFSAAAFLLVDWKNVKYGKFEDLLKWSVVPFFFAGMLVTSLWSLKELSLSAVLILRNLLPILTFFAEKLLFNSPQQVSRTMLLSMGVAFVGTIMYGHSNVAVTSRGILIITLNCVLTVVDRLLQRYLLKSPDFSVSLPMCMVLNNVIGIFLILGLAAGTGEMLLWHSMARQASSSSWALVFFSCICGCCLGYLGLRCQKLVSATSFLVLQNLAKVMILFLGMGIFGDKIRGVSAIGCLLSMCGALCYGYERLPQETDDSKTRGSDHKSEAEKILALKKQYGTP